MARRGLDDVAVPTAARRRRTRATGRACIVPRHMSIGSSNRPATTGTGWSRRCRPIDGWSRPVACRIAGVRSAPAARTTTGARTTSRPRHRRRPAGPDDRSARRSPASVTTAVPSDADRPPALQQHRDDPDPRHDPGSGGVGPREMDPEPRLLRAARAPERTTAAGAAVGRVPPGRGGLPAQRRRPAQDRRVLRRDDGRRRDAELGLDRRDVGVPGRRRHALRGHDRRPTRPGPPRARRCSSSS